MSETISANTTIAQYTVVSKLGAGGMGEVYRARDSKLGRDVAIKVLSAEVARDSDRMRRFEQEARATSALNHPHILTVHDLGLHGNSPFIVAELLEGEELRAVLKRGELTLSRALDYAQQIASGLAAAHAKGVVHRDLKPENLFVTKDGFIKILDFGLAKLTEQSNGDTKIRRLGEASTLLPASPHLLVAVSPVTSPGAVMGTASYMSPEQARGLEVDARSDIFSLGVVLYEMLAGRAPFAGVNAIDVMGSILNKEPTPLRQHIPDAPRELEHLIEKTLRKDRDQRYQTSKDLLIDLKDLKEELEFAAKLERTIQPDKPQSMTTPPAVINTAEMSAAHTASSAEYLVTQIKSHKRGALIAAAITLLVTIAASYFIFLRKPSVPVLTDKDTILLTEFDNKTGETVFDGTLRQGLAVQLQQSPFLDIFPDQRVRATLRLMSRSPDERVTRESGREICQRQGLKAFIAGSIAKFDRNYSITLEALNGQTGDPLALVQVEAEGKDEVLKALSRAAAELRERLGESLSSIQTFDAPLEVTTSSLDALKEYALGRDEGNKGQYLKAIEYHRRAIEKDPNFAIAWLGLAIGYSNTNQPRRAAECAAKAFALRDRASEDEKGRITSFYYSEVTGELDQAIVAQESYIRSYPRDSRGPTNLSDRYLRTGEFEKALAAVQEGLRLNPISSAGNLNLVEILLRLNRFAEAGEAWRRALEKKIDNSIARGFLHSIAFINGDARAMQEQIAWASGKTDEYVAVDWQTETSSFAGEWRKSQDFSRRSTEMALRNEAKENAAGYTAEQAMRAAWLGQFAEGLALAEAALKIERNWPTLTNAALALALSGEAAKAQSLIAELEQQFPKDTRVNQLWLPEVKAALELRKGNPQAALDPLESTRRFEPAGEFWPQTLRAMAYLKLGKSAEAANEYRKIIDHRGEGARSLLWPLAHLGLGRALALQGDKAQAKQSYEAFFKLWSNADADLAILIEAKKEYEKLK